jgi:hypothetical protein
MRLAAFLLRSRPVHPEHAEHHARHRTLRITMADLHDTTVVVRCGRVARWRLLAALALMKLAGKLGGFRTIKLVRESHD